MFDLVIIGAGPAGITAAVYAARKRMNFMVITDNIGGQAAWSGDIENYTGYQFVTGTELTDKFEQHMRNYDVQLKENEIVHEVKEDSGIIYIKTNKGVYEAKSVIIASGKRSRELGVPGEKEFKNKGLTYCATCDGPLFADRDVAVIGGGNSALDAALQLIKIARKIYIINNSAELNGDAILQQKVTQSAIVTALNSAQVLAVVGEKIVSGIKIKRQGYDQQLSVQGIFVEIGLIPNSDFVLGVEKNELGEIKVNSRNETNIPGIFAAGDVTDVLEKQIIIAAGEGSKATLSVFKYLSHQG